MKFQTHFRLWTTGVLFIAAGGAAAQEQRIENQPLREIESQEASWTDRRLYRMVELNLARNSLVPAHTLDVRVENGTVYLDGTVASLAEKEQAAEVARNLRGVQAVQNNISVLEHGWDDRELRSQVLAGLSEAIATEMDDLRVEVRNGIVRLSGEVQSIHERFMAEQTAVNIAGVREVENRIQLNIPKSRPDHELEADIESRLRWSSRVSDYNLEAEVENGVARLYGTVESEAHRRWAEQLAAIPGIREVITERLDVRAPAREDYDNQRQESRQAHLAAGASAGAEQETRRVPEGRTEELVRAIKAQFSSYPSVAGANLEIESNEGLVTLSGRVETLSAKRLAGNLAGEIKGVRRVYNLLKVRPQSILPAQVLRERVQNAFARDAYFNEADVRVNVRTGRIRLNGTVDSYQERARAERIASAVPGVLAVRNQLRVSPDIRTMDYFEAPPYIPGTPSMTLGDELKEDVNDQMFWSPFVDADDVSVGVSGRTVTLTGTVDSWSERQAAAANAVDAGAAEVVNNLSVE